MKSVSHLLAELAEIETETVMVLSTARTHGQGPHRLPDRQDRGKPVTTIQVETDEQARFVLQALDRPGRHIYIDVERKQDIHLGSVAREVVLRARVHSTKPNDTTVDALSALLTQRIGDDVSDIPITIFGTGNLGFKFALRLAERGAEVALTGRNAENVELLVSAMNKVIPQFSPHPVKILASPFITKVLISAVTATGAIDSPWLDQLAPKSLCIDVGIGNFTPRFIEEAHRHHHTVMRLDVRSAGDPLPLFPNDFFTTVAGKRTIGKHDVVAGGLIGQRGTIVVDNITQPTLMVGIANGTGGLLPEADWDFSMRQHVCAVLSWIATTAST